MAETIKRLTQENNSLKSAATGTAQEVGRLQEEVRRLQDEAQSGAYETIALPPIVPRSCTVKFNK